MKFITNEKITASLKYDKLIYALFEMFCSQYNMPLRHHHFYPTKNDGENTLILMPAWNEEYLGIKQIILAPGNQAKEIPTVSALYTLFKMETGEPLAMMNAQKLTSLRTACTSALAAKYLAVEKPKVLLVVGGGKVAKHLIQAHSVVRNYSEIFVWLRDKNKFAEFLKHLPEEFKDKVRFADDLEKIVSKADVISTATMSVDPIIKGEWLKKGVYLDLIGSYKPTMREVNDAAILKSKIFVDSRMGALHETGELAIPIEKGLIKETDIVADLRELCIGKQVGRSDENEIILFKSAGLAIEDLAGALLVYQSTLS